MSRTKTNRSTDREQYTRSNTATVRLLIGETGRNLSTRLTEHKRATKNGDVNNHIAEHHLQAKKKIVLPVLQTTIRGTQREYSSKPLNIALLDVDIGIFLSPFSSVRIS